MSDLAGRLEDQAETLRLMYREQQHPYPSDAEILDALAAEVGELEALATKLSDSLGDWQNYWTKLNNDHVRAEARIAELERAGRDYKQTIGDLSDANVELEAALREIEAMSGGHPDHKCGQIARAALDTSPKGQEGGDANRTADRSSNGSTDYQRDMNEGSGDAATREDAGAEDRALSASPEPQDPLMREAERIKGEMFPGYADEMTLANPLPQDPEQPCPTCKGRGYVPVRGLAFHENSDPCPDPNCPACGGKGRVWSDLTKREHGCGFCGGSGVKGGGE